MNIIDSCYRFVQRFQDALDKYRRNGGQIE